MHFTFALHFSHCISVSKGLLYFKISTKLYISIFLLFNILLGVLVWLCSCLIILSGDAELNPGPKNSVSKCFSICQWNLNSISTHRYSETFLLKVYISVHKFDIICLSETYLDSTAPLDDDNLVISGYNLIRSDHPSNTKRGGVCLYYKNYLPLRVLNISYLKECLNFELNIGDKSCNFIAFIGPQASLKTILKPLITLKWVRNSGAKRFFFNGNYWWL